ncbi:outer membrane protein [Mangrovimonas sp. ST2L15]|uniref:outer membrane protein n=1 Tax=Mangrovimonas sp. ST2L15 TaxID=1645916 RepID=UPI0006B5E123|nr:hypothetical protein [Mangrovimonas sp. ST2L15]
MKKILFILILIGYSTFIKAQETADQNESQSNESKGLSVKPQMYFYTLHHFNYGNNFLSDGHEPKLAGVGFQLNTIEYYNFKLGFGFDYMRYDVTNVATIGNINRTHYHSAYGKILYQWDITKPISLEPYVGLGAVQVRQNFNLNLNALNEDSNSFYGMIFYAGLNVTFNLIDHFSVYVGGNYNNVSFNIDTHKTWEDYFNKINQAQIHLGLIVTFGDN